MANWVVGYMLVVDAGGYKELTELASDRLSEFLCTGL